MKKDSDIAERLQRQVNQLDLLREVAKKLVEVRDLDELARHILEGAKKLISFTDGSIGLVDEGVITFPYAIGESADSVMKFRLSIGHGLTGWAVQNKQPTGTGDTSKDKRYHNQIKTTKSELDVPIIYNGDAIGVINVESTQVNAFSKDDECLLVNLAEHAAVAVNNARLFNEMNALIDINKRLTSTLDFTAVLELILKTASGLIKCPEVSVGVLDLETNTLRFTLARGPSKDSVLTYAPSSDIGLTGRAIREKIPVRVGNVTLDPRYQPQIGSTRSELDVPLLIGEKVYGVLNAESPNTNAFSEHDEHLLSALASQAALAVRNAEMYEEVKKDLQATREREIAAETMAAIGDVAGNLVHRLNNDIGAIRVRAEMIELAMSENDTKLDEPYAILEKANTIHELAEKVLGEVRSFRERYKDIEPAVLDVNKIIHAALDDVKIPQGIVVMEELDDNLAKVYGAGVHLKEVFRNLLSNAVSAMPEGGNLWVKSQQQGAKIIIRVKDSGTGILDENLQYVFERGFTTKKEGQGLGYGLWWVKTYLNRRGGDIGIEETKLGVGSTFLVSLPKHEVSNLKQGD